MMLAGDTSTRGDAEEEVGETVLMLVVHSVIAPRTAP